MNCWNKNDCIVSFCIDLTLQGHANYYLFSQKVFGIKLPQFEIVAGSAGMIVVTQNYQGFKQLHKYYSQQRPSIIWN
jgi:hypothetical protein